MSHTLRYLCFSFLALFLCQTVFADSKSEDYNNARKRYNFLYNLPDAGLPLAMLGADSLIAAGKANDNFRVTCLGYGLRGRTYYRMGRIEEAIVAEETKKDISLKNKDYETYFHAYLCQCDYQQVTNSGKAMVMGQKMMAKANQLKYMPGLAWAHEQMGNLNLYTLQDFSTASAHYRDAINIVQKSGGNLGPDIIRLYIEYATSLGEEEKFDESEKILQLLETTYKGRCSEDQELSVLFVKIDNAYNRPGCTAAEYDDLYQQTIRHPMYEMLITPDTRLYYKIRWLIRTGRELQALSEIPQLELTEDRYLLKAQAFESLGDWKNASIMKDSMDIAKDSIMHHLRAEELVELDAEMKNSELAMEAADNKVLMQSTILVSVVIFFVLALVVIIYIAYRRRKNMKLLEAKNEELRRAKEAAEKANNAKTIFIQNMSHEFHTPLNHIYGFAQVMVCKDVPFDEEQFREMSQNIVESSEHLTKILDDFVDFVDNLSTLDKLSDKESIMK